MHKRPYFRGISCSGHNLHLAEIPEVSLSEHWPCAAFSRHLHLVAIISAQRENEAYTLELGSPRALILNWGTGEIRRHAGERMMWDKVPLCQTVHQKTDLRDNKDLKHWCSGFKPVTLTHNNLLNAASIKGKRWMDLTCGGVRDRVSE